jgi:hypothetical protein
MKLTKPQYEVLRAMCDGCEFGFDPCLLISLANAGFVMRVCPVGNPITEIGRMAVSQYEGKAGMAIVTELECPDFILIGS